MPLVPESYSWFPGLGSVEVRVVARGEHVRFRLPVDQLRRGLAVRPVIRGGAAVRDIAGANEIRNQ